MVNELFKFQKGIYTRVVVPNEDEDAELKLEYENDVLSFYLKGKLIFAGDWTANFLEVFTIFLEELGERK